MRQPGFPMFYQSTRGPPTATTNDPAGALRYAHNRSGPEGARLVSGSGAFGGRERRPDGSAARRRADCVIATVCLRCLDDFIDDFHMIYGKMARMVRPMMGRVISHRMAVSSEEGVSAGAGVSPCGGALQAAVAKHVASRRASTRRGFTWCMRPARGCVRAACACVGGRCDGVCLGMAESVCV